MCRQESAWPGQFVQGGGLRRTWEGGQGGYRFKRGDSGQTTVFREGNGKCILCDINTAINCFTLPKLILPIPKAIWCRLGKFPLSHLLVVSQRNLAAGHVGRGASCSHRRVSIAIFIDQSELSFWRLFSTKHVFIENNLYSSISRLLHPRSGGRMEVSPANSCCFCLTLRSGTITIGLGNCIFYLSMFTWYVRKCIFYPTMFTGKSDNIFFYSAC